MAQESNSGLGQLAVEALSSETDSIATHLAAVLEDGLSNEAVERLGAFLSTRELAHGTLSNSVSPHSRSGHKLTFSLGEFGFISAQMFKPMEFTLPLIVEKGNPNPGDPHAGCPTTYGDCTLRKVGGECQADKEFDDPDGMGLMFFGVPGVRPLGPFGQDEIQTYSRVLARGLELIADGAAVAIEELRRWATELANESSVLAVDVSVTTRASVTFVDWAVRFENGCSGLIQVAVGDVRPAYDLGGDEAESNLREANVDLRPGAESLGPVVDVPHVWVNR